MINHDNKGKPNQPHWQASTQGQAALMPLLAQPPYGCMLGSHGLHLPVWGTCSAHCSTEAALQLRGLGSPVLTVAQNSHEQHQYKALPRISTATKPPAHVTHLRRSICIAVQSSRQRSSHKNNTLFMYKLAGGCTFPAIHAPERLRGVVLKLNDRIEALQEHTDILQQCVRPPQPTLLTNLNLVSHPSSAIASVQVICCAAVDSTSVHNS